MRGSITGARSKAALQGPKHAGGDPGRVPVHPHHRPERGNPAAVQRQVGALGAPPDQPSTIAGGGADPDSAAPNNGSGAALAPTGSANFDTVTPTSLIPVLGG